MARTDIQLVVEGPDAEAVARELSESVFENLGHRAEPIQMGTGIPGPDKKFDPAWLDTGLKAAGFLVSLPASALAVLNFAERLKKKPKAEKYLEDAQKFLEAHPGAEISLRLPDGRFLRIRGTDADTLMDSFTEASR